MQTTTTLQIFTKNITQTIEVFDKNLKLSSTLNQSQKDLIEKNNFELEKSCNDILSILSKLNKEHIFLNQVIQNEFFRNLLNDISAWILKNFNSPKLTTILGLISSLLSAYGHNVEIQKKEIQKLIECDTYEHLTEKKEEELSKEETLSKDSILTNPFLSALYSLIVTISNKTEIILKSKHLLKILTTLSAQIVEIDNVGLYFKKRRLISVFNTIIKELKKSTDENVHSSLIQITKLTMFIFSKIGIRRPIYRDYMFKKAIPDRISDVYLQNYANDKELISVFALYTVFSSRTSDHKTFYWTKGIITTFCEILSSNKDENILESVSLAVYILTKDSSEIQEDLRDQNYLDLAKKLVVNYSTNNNIVYFTVATLRRIKDEDFYNKMSQELLYTFFALFDYYYIAVKKEINELKDKKENISILSTQTQFVVLKEIVAILGNIVKNEIHSKPFIDKNLHLVLIDVKLSFIMFPKLVKNTIGALINLTNSQEVRDNLCKIAAFVQSIYLVLDQYKDNQFIIDYELKLIVNILKNDIAINTFVSGDLLYYVLLFIKNFKTHPEIVLNSIKIIRCLIVKIKGMEEFLKKVFEFNQAIYDFKETDPKEKGYQYFIDDMINFLNAENELMSIEVKIEIINLLAYLSNQNKEFKELIGKSKELNLSLNALISKNAKDELSNKMISLAIAQLPIEELNMINH